MLKKVFNTPDAVIVGPYSQAVESGNLIYFSGQIPLDAATGKLIEGDISAQTEQCFKNLLKVLTFADLTTDNIVKVTVFLTDMNDYASVNNVYAKYFSSPYPARTAVAVTALPLGSKVEIEVIAQKPL
ncbi:MAG: RidA family protein [Candidatus Gastranaerophilaceae bacterium]|jgi:2-iminobutanoate/2-iminopropanoate deaminase